MNEWSAQTCSVEGKLWFEPQGWHPNTLRGPRQVGDCEGRWRVTRARWDSHDMSHVVTQQFTLLILSRLKSNQFKKNLSSALAAFSFSSPRSLLFQWWSLMCCHESKLASDAFRRLNLWLNSNLSTSLGGFQIVPKVFSHLIRRPCSTRQTFENDYAGCGCLRMTFQYQISSCRNSKISVTFWYDRSLFQTPTVALKITRASWEQVTVARNPSLTSVRPLGCLEVSRDENM